MTDKSITNKFDVLAKDYDKNRKNIIPNLDQLYGTVVEIARAEIPEPKILDLGAGTGLLTEKLSERFARGQFTLVDISNEMLNIARERFNERTNFSYINQDYLEADLGDNFDLVVSSLSIHHLSNKEKQYLYSKVYAILNPNGIFINADQVLGPSRENEYIYRRNWIEKIEAGDLSVESKNKIMEILNKHDKPASLENNLKWLKKCGFRNVDVFYKYYNFSVMYGVK